MSEIWRACAGQAAPVRLGGTIHRVVESQEQVATNALVDTLAEQALLEELLERSKPPLADGSRGLHYLLATPFRYPPLPWGSRFGSRFEPSLFYAARHVDTALAEGAFYRFVFWTGMQTPPPAPLHTRHTVFAPEIDTVVVSNSVSLPFELGAFGKLAVVSCAPLLAEAIQRLHSGASIHRLLNPLP